MKIFRIIRGFFRCARCEKTISGLRKELGDWEHKLSEVLLHQASENHEMQVRENVRGENKRRKDIEELAILQKEVVWWKEKALNFNRFHK